MGVAAEILEHVSRAAERRLGINHPFGLGDGSEVLGEGGTLTQTFEFSEKLKLILIESLPQGVEKQAAE